MRRPSLRVLIHRGPAFPAPRPEIPLHAMYGVFDRVLADGSGSESGDDYGGDESE